MNLTPYINNWIIQGKFYGYPDCCIVAFVHRTCDIKAGEIKDITESQRAVLDGNGFVPCDKCAKKLLKEGKTIDTLIQNRVCGTNYPHSTDSDGEIEEYAQSLGYGKVKTSE